MINSRKLLVSAAVSLPTLLIVVLGYLAISNKEENKFVGSSSCRECHQTFYDLWETSLHSQTLRSYSYRFASSRLPLDPATMETGDGCRIKIQPESGLVIVSDKNGMHELRISHVIGGKNVYYFLAPLQRGFLQTLPIAFDIRKQVWFQTALSGVRHFSDSTRDAPLPWTHRAFTFNTSCHRCHVSQASTNYDVMTDSYSSVWEEPGINCETCHGSGVEHLKVMREKNGNVAAVDNRIISTRQFSVDQTNEMCAPCHAKGAPITEAFTPGERYFDHFDLVTLEDPDFFPDGRDLGENYTYTSWLLSPCVKSGQLSCLHCHTSGGRFRFESNPDAACLPCHANLVKNPEPHTRHNAEAGGGRCIGCHMPVTEFARMRRSDHSMLPPTPASTIAFGSPNACSICHAGKSTIWADSIARKWYPEDYQKPVLHRASLVDAARRRDWARLPDIIDYIKSDSGNAVFVASLVRLLRSCDNERKWEPVLHSLSSSSPLVRSSALEAFDGHVAPQYLPNLVRSVADEFRLVRIRSASLLAGSDLTGLSKSHQVSVDQATDELVSSMKSRSDDYSSQFNLGNLYSARSQFQQAIEHYEIASRLEPNDVAVLVNVSLAYSALGRTTEAEKRLRAALRLKPATSAAHLNLGLLLGETNRMEEAEESLRAAFTHDSTCAPAAYNLAVIVAGKDIAESIRWCRKAVALQPENAKYREALAIFQSRLRSETR